MMADLTPDESAALMTALELPTELMPTKESIAIWRAARAYQAEQDAQLADARAGKHDHAWEAFEAHAADIRERAKGLT